MKQLGLLKAMYLTKRADRLTKPQRQVLQEKRLQELLRYVRKNSPYFAEKYRDIPTDAPLSAYPPSNKQDMMANFDRWMTDSNITLEKVHKFMEDKNNIGHLLNGKYHVYSTSGSTGRPCIALYDKTAFHVSSAIGVLRSFARPQDMKAFLKSGRKTIALYADDGFYLGCGSVRYNLQKMPWKKNTMKTCDVRKPMKEIIDILNDFQPSMIGCYPTAMELIAAEQEAGRLHIHPAIIMTGGEKLTDPVRTHLEQVFGCYVQTNYSCTEGGTMACECTGHRFHINDDWVILEAVDENNQPVPFGAQSAKVLLTNLANKTCPFIRFEITDRITIYDTPCPCGCDRLWLTLEGRTDDILIFRNGVRIAPLSLYAVLKEVKGIDRFQLIQQKDDRLELRLAAKEKEVCFQKAQNTLCDYLAQNGVTADIFLSDAEPKASTISGKFKHIVAYHS